MRVSLLSLLLLVLSHAYGQLNFDYTQGRFLVKGTVVDLQTKKPVGNTNIKILNSGRGITTDADGQFNMYLAITDTLKFSNVGYISKVQHVADWDTLSYYTLKVELMRDFVKIKEVVIYPFKDVDEFKKAFVEAREINKVNVPGIAPPKYSNQIPKAKFSNPISFIYERAKNKRAANPDFRP